MIYNSLRTLPKVVQVDIWETGNLFLLDTDYKDGQETNIEYIEQLTDVWKSIEDEFNRRFNKSEGDKVFKLLKEIEYLKEKYECVQMALDSLHRRFDQRLVDMLSSPQYGYKVDLDNYDQSIEQIDRESKGILSKIKIFEKQLPKKPELDKSKPSEQIIMAMGGYMAVLGVDFDFYTISVEKYHALEAQVDAKIKSLEKQAEQSKRK